MSVHPSVPPRPPGYLPCYSLRLHKIKEAGQGNCLLATHSRGKKNKKKQLNLVHASQDRVDYVTRRLLRF